MPHDLHIDIESRSKLDLRKTAVHRYAQDPATEIICVAFCIDDGAVHTWIPGQPIPVVIRQAVRFGYNVRAFNAMFERTMWNHILGPRLGWPVPKLSQFRCTMTQARAVALPAKLAKLANTLHLQHQKDLVGGRVLMQVTRPRRARVGEDPNGVYYYDDTERLQRVYEYNRQDVETEREIAWSIPELSDAEQELWQLDQIINDTGFAVDLDLARAARKIAAAVRPEINTEIQRITAGDADSSNEVARLKQWCAQQGVLIDTFDKRILANLLTTELPDQVREVLELRRDGAQAASYKIEAILAREHKGRIYGAFSHHAAGTGRWSGSGFQPQNLKRVEKPEPIIAAVATGDLEIVRQRGYKPLQAIGDCSRGMIVAAPGHVLMGADFKGIEARVVAWVAGQDDKLEMFRKFDRDPVWRNDPYVVTAEKVLGVVLTAGDKVRRQVGKTCELAFGFAGGAPAFRRFSPDSLFTDTEINAFRDAWRRAHPQICIIWNKLQDTAIKTMHNANCGQNPGYNGRVANGQDVWFYMSDGFLFMQLPSTRWIAYPAASNRYENLGRFGDKPKVFQVPLGTAFRSEQVYGFMDNSLGQWRANIFSRSLLIENVVSGIARDLLTAAMLRIHAAGLKIVAHIHDELIVEVPKDQADVATYQKLMTELPPWAAGLPVASDVWVSDRYTK